MVKTKQNNNNKITLRKTKHHKKEPGELKGRYRLTKIEMMKLSHTNRL